jgi:hypothetical protein
MLQLSIALLFVVAGFASAAVVGQTLRRAWSAVGELRQALAQCDEVQPVEVRTYAIERRIVISAEARFNRAATARRTASPACALPVAA